MKVQHDLTVYTDGGARGNPGPAAYGFVVFDISGKKLYEEGRTVGIDTNNVAEYSGIVAALKWIEQNSNIENAKIVVFMDSQLAAMQLSGHWKIKNETLRSLYFTIKNIEQKLSAEITYTNIPREQNKEADSLVNLALDGKV